MHSEPELGRYDDEEQDDSTVGWLAQEMEHAGTHFLLASWLPLLGACGWLLRAGRSRACVRKNSGLLFLDDLFHPLQADAIERTPGRNASRPIATISLSHR